MSVRSSYSYLRDSIMSDDDIYDMLDLNPYPRERASFFGWLRHGVPEHDNFNEMYSIAYQAGAFHKLLEFCKLLREKGIEKEELRKMVNQVCGQEILKPKANVL